MFTVKNCVIRTGRYPFIKPFVLSGGTITSFLQLFCEIETTDGVLGLGHSGISPVWSDKRPDVSFDDKERQSVELAGFVAGRLAGRSFENPFEAFDFMKAAADEFSAAIGLPRLSRYVCLSPIDMAVWDAYARFRDQNVFECIAGEFPELGRFFGAPRDLEVAHTIGVGEDPAVELKFAVKHGIRWFKLKLKGNIEDDIRAIKKFFSVFSGISPQVILDGNEGYSANDLESLVSALSKEEFFTSVEYIEQPVSRSGGESVMVAGDTVPVFADEMVCDCGDLMVARRLGYRGIALKPTAKTLSETVRMLPLIEEIGFKVSIADLTNAAPLAYLFHCAFASRIENRVEGVEINSPKFIDNDLQKRRVKERYRFLFEAAGGKIRMNGIGTGKGLGFDVDLKDIKQTILT